MSSLQPTLGCQQDENTRVDGILLFLKLCPVLQFNDLNSRLLAESRQNNIADSLVHAFRARSISTKGVVDAHCSKLVIHEDTDPMAIDANSQNNLLLSPDLLDAYVHRLGFGPCTISRPVA
jgi:hypothetical protein